MSETKNGNLRPDGFSVSLIPSISRLGVLGLSGTYYWNPGSDDSPSFTVTGIAGGGKDVNSAEFKGLPGLLGLLGRAGLGAGPVFLRSGMTSKDTLGRGITSNVSTMIPSDTVNSSFPNGILSPKVSSIESGVSSNIGAYEAGTYTVSGRQIGDALIAPAMGPEDELSPFARTLQSGAGTVGQSAAPPIRFLGSRARNPLGDGMGRFSPSGINPLQPTPQRHASGGLLGFLLITCKTIEFSR